MEKQISCEFSVDGMHCDACEVYMESVLKKQAGVVSVLAKSNGQKVQVSLKDGTDISELKQKVNEIITNSGYKIVDSITVEELSRKKMVFSFLLAFIIVTLFLVLQSLNITSLFVADELTYSAIFLLGVLASLSTCMAVVGGIAMTLASKFTAEQKGKSIVVFQVARLVGFILLGGVIGYVGKIVVVNATVSAIFRIIVAFAMVTVGADLIGLKLPKLVLPKQITNMFGLFEDKDGWTSAVLLGVGTFFMPCAFTQSMQLYAMSTGSLVKGAFIMGTFALGTLPVLSLVSVGSAAGVTAWNKGIFGHTMGFLILLFALLNIVSALGTFGIIPLLVL